MAARRLRFAGTKRSRHVRTPSLAAGQAPDRLTAEPSVLVEGIEWHVASRRQRRDREVADACWLVVASQINGTITVIGSAFVQQRRPSRQPGLRHLQVTKYRQQFSEFAFLCTAVANARRKPGGDGLVRQIERPVTDIGKPSRNSGSRHRPSKFGESGMILCPGQMIG